MKRNTAKILSAAIAAATAIVLPGCGNNAGKATPTEKETASQKKEVSQSAGIAYVCIDSILNNYKFCADQGKLLEKRMNNIRATLESKGQALQNAAVEFQRKAQNGEIKSQEEGEKMQASLQKQQADLEKLQEKYTVQFEKERQSYYAAMEDSIENFLKDYNKNRRYSMILSKAGSNILYAEKKMDITEEVLAGLNKRYKSADSGKKTKK